MTVQRTTEKRELDSSSSEEEEATLGRRPERQRPRAIESPTGQDELEVLPIKAGGTLPGLKGLYGLLESAKAGSLLAAAAASSSSSKASDSPPAKRVKLEDLEPWQSKQLSVNASLDSNRVTAMKAYTDSQAAMSPKIKRVDAAQRAVDATTAQLKKQQADLAVAKIEQREGAQDVSWAAKQVTAADNKLHRYRRAAEDFEAALGQLVTK